MYYKKKIDAEIYKKTVTINDSLSRQNINLVFISKSVQVKQCLNFNYYFTYKDILISQIEAATTIHDLLNILSYQCLFSADIKYKYWVVNIHSDDYHYLVIYIPKIGQVQPTCMS